MLRSQIDHLQKGKATAEKLSKQLEQQLNEMHVKLDEHAKQIHDFTQQQIEVNW